jgi:hypothetical protein
LQFETNCVTFAANNITMPKETLTFRPSKKNADVLKKLAKLAAKENRSLNNYIENLFVNHIDKTKSFKDGK